MAPCATQTSSYWAFAGGSTVSGNALALALFNPAAPEAVVNVSFVTGNGLVTPQAYQGLIVPSGQLIVENVGSYVQNVADIGTVVTVQSGNLVSSEFQQSSQGSGGLALRLGAPSLSSVWRFAQTTVRPGTQVAVRSGQPGHDAVTATLSLGLSEGTVVPRRITIPPLSIVDYAASGTGGLPQQTAFSVTINASGAHCGWTDGGRRQGIADPRLGVVVRDGDREHPLAGSRPRRSWCARHPGSHHVHAGRGQPRSIGRSGEGVEPRCLSPGHHVHRAPGRGGRPRP